MLPNLSRRERDRQSRTQIDPAGWRVAAAGHAAVLRSVDGERCRSALRIHRQRPAQPENRRRALVLKRSRRIFHETSIGAAHLQAVVKHDPSAAPLSSARRTNPPRQHSHIADNSRASP